LYALLSALLSTLLLGGCASAPVAVRSAPVALLHDSLFQPASADVNADRLFAVTPAMRQYLQDEIVHKQVGKDARQSLFDALYKRGKLRLEYDATMTRNAEETFLARSGNCLSLAIMTAALARELNLTVQFQRVTLENSWSRNGNLYFSSNHVNLVLGQPKLDFARGYNIAQYMTVDFIPVPDLAKQQAQPLDENTIIAMYMNNRAAEMLVEDRVDDAYWWARMAMHQNPAYLNSYNTLAVVYQHHHDLTAAEQVMRYVLQQEPGNTIFMFNLVQMLEDQGRMAEAAPLRVQLARLDPYPAFHFFNQGQAAMQAGDYAGARSLFQRELDREPDYHEFHFWLAQADYQMGDLKEADKHMTLAMENSTTRGDHDLYAAKLDRIKSYEARLRHQ
jgi:Tfp pilus assembly protein PilF